MPHPSINAMMRFFDYDHLPPELQDISKPFADLADKLVANLGHIQEPGAGAQLNRALQKLLESKDCAVRAALPTE